MIMKYDDLKLKLIFNKKKSIIKQVNLYGLAKHEMQISSMGLVNVSNVHLQVFFVQVMTTVLT